MNRFTSFEEIVYALDGRMFRDDRATARCPAHADKNPSLQLTRGEGGRTLLKCWAGCDQASVIGALQARGLWNAPKGVISRRAIVRVKAPDPRQRQWLGEDIDWMDEDPPAQCVWTILQQAFDMGGPILLEAASRTMRKHRPSSTKHIRAWMDAWFSDAVPAEMEAA